MAVHKGDFLQLPVSSDLLEGIQVLQLVTELFLGSIFATFAHLGSLLLYILSVSLLSLTTQRPPEMCTRTLLAQQLGGWLATMWVGMLLLASVL